MSVNGEKLDDEEFEFIVLEPIKLFNIEKTDHDNGEYVPDINGIYDNEKVNIGDIRKLSLVFRKKYTTNEYRTFSNCFYRLYVKEGNKEIDVINWHPIEKRFLSNRFYIDTNDLIPNNYFIDIRTGSQVYKAISEFQVVSNITKRYM